MCSECGGVGWYKKAVPFHHPDFGKLFPCECLAERQQGINQQRAQRFLAQLATEVGEFQYKTLRDFDVNRRVSHGVTWYGGREIERIYTVQEQQKSLKSALFYVQSYVQQPENWLFLAGPWGSGKTHLATAAANELTAEARTASYSSTPALLRHLRRGFSDNTTDERLETLMCVDVLVLDDIGSEQLTGWSEPILFDLLNARYNYRRLTILTSNLPMAKIRGRIGSRITGLSRFIPVIATDYRVERGEGLREVAR